MLLRSLLVILHDHRIAIKEVELKLIRKRSQAYSCLYGIKLEAKILQRSQGRDLDSLSTLPTEAVSPGQGKSRDAKDHK